MQKITEEYLMGFVPERFLTDERYRNGHINILASNSGTKVLGMHTPEMKKGSQRNSEKRRLAKTDRVLATSQATLWGRWINP